MTPDRVLAATFALSVLAGAVAAAAILLRNLPSS